ncbi:S-adenosyl-L-methionine-dependent methyltransferase [Parathielavia appendiculata]|uniref:S-adenosyl-L-methionine-dependent methyltransferase n=1 Tax=Parathielavia appendiculata TaxID=2587402 RepID=A0AAN6U7L7_9PEZI|nr:S-adenosyl-L-methionine-dependent methyltransferase [Parathielavia appendiculata]
MSVPTDAKSASDETTDLSKQYDTPLGLAHTTMQALKDRIKLHYDLASDYYLNLWGEHIHHGYWPTATSKATDTKETAQLNLIRLLLSISSLSKESSPDDNSNTTTAPPAPASEQPLRILDVGCGIGGTSRYLASHLGASVTGITISSKQVQIARRLSKAAVAAVSTSSSGTSSSGIDEQHESSAKEGEFIPLGSSSGQVRFLELDAEKMGDYFSGDGEEPAAFDVIWVSEALSHFPDKARFFRDAARLLDAGKGKKGSGRLVVADWFRAEALGEAEFERDIKPIEDGMLLPPLCTQQEYVDMAKAAGLELLGGPKDISKDVSKTWDISWSLVQNPSLWAFAFSQGRDGIAFLQAFRAMRRGYANGSFRYAVMALAKP